MHPIALRKTALHIYSLLQSLRKTALMLEVSHMTISRWISKPERKKYERKIISKTDIIKETLKSITEMNPLVTLEDLQKKISKIFDFSISTSSSSTLLLFREADETSDFMLRAILPVAASRERTLTLTVSPTLTTLSTDSTRLFYNDATCKYPSVLNERRQDRSPRAGKCERDPPWLLQN